MVRYVPTAVFVDISHCRIAHANRENATQTNRHRQQQVQTGQLEDCWVVMRAALRLG